MPDKNLKILFVDDDPDTGIAISDAFESKGYQFFRTAASGQEALNLMAQQIPDVLVSDHDMPDMTGFELIQAVHRNPAYSNIKIIITSSDWTIGARALAAGADAFLRKVYDFANLEAAIDGILPQPEGTPLPPSCG